VIRYLALREERVTVRYIVHQDKALLESLAAKVKEGADFATLALRHSEDQGRRDGGLLPPFGRGFPHPVADIAFTLQPGQLSGVETRNTHNGPRQFLVYCLARQPGRDVKFADVSKEIDAELEKKPLSRIETDAYTLRWRSALEQKAPQEKHDTSPSGR
jgi:parvulin-like peptidyl-prolyl isomerase